MVRGSGEAAIVGEHKSSSEEYPTVTLRGLRSNEQSPSFMLVFSSETEAKHPSIPLSWAPYKHWSKL